MSRPILILDPPEQAPPKKEKTITIYKQNVYNEVDAKSYKYAESRPDMSPQQGNAVASDSSERLDGHVITRNVELRDAMLREKIDFALKDDAVVTESNDKLTLEDSFVYNLMLYPEFKDALVAPLTKFIHRYLVSGALLDWYTSIGDSQASVYEKEVKTLENTIHNMLIGPVVRKRPLQPFGPAYKIPV